MARVVREKTALIAAACAGFAAWISLGSLAIAETSAGLDRLGLLPPLWLLPVLIAGFVGIAWVIRLAGATSLPLFFSLILLLPWLPGSIPAAFLLWTARMVVGVWLIVIVAMISLRMGTIGPSNRLRQGFGESAVALRAEAERMGPTSTPLAAAAVAFALYVISGSSLAAARTIPGGDEPHYLVLTQSLLRDRDLQIENNHARGDYREYFGGVLRPDYLKRGIDGAIYSIHAPGLPAIVAPAYALFGYPGVVIFLSMVGAIGSALLWRASYVLTESHSAAWFGWAAGALTVPFFFEAFAVFPDGVGATVILFAAVPLLSSESSVGRARWIFTGAALAVLPWLHTRFALISAVFGVVLLLRLFRLPATDRSRILLFLLFPALSAIAWFGFFKAIYGTFNPSAPYGGYTQSSPLNIFRGLSGLLVDQQFGILPNAPVYGFCFAGLIALARRRLRLALELSAISASYVLAVSAFHMWWGGSSSPARFVVPVLPLLALPGAWLWKSTPHFSTRAIGLGALLVSLAITAMMVVVDGGRLAYNFRDGYARVGEWLSPVVDLPQGLPSLFRQTPFGAWVRASFWFAAVFGVVLVVRGLEARGASRAKLAFATPVALAIAVMLSLTAIWKMDGVEARRTGISQLHLLQHYDTRVRPIGITPAAVRFESPDRILAKVNIATTERQTQSLLLVPGIVAGGRYELRLAHPATATGTAALVIGRMASAIKTWDLTKDFVSGSAELDLPVNVGSLVIERHTTAADPEVALTLHPKQIWEGSARLTGDFARRAQRYGPAVIYFFDDGAFAENPGFWIRGGGFSQIAAAQMGDAAPLRLFVRNAPVVNRLTLEIDEEEHVLDLQPREEQLVPIHVAQGRPAALIRFRSDNGFRPSETEPGSTDTRFLGVWIEFR